MAEPSMEVERLIQTAIERVNAGSLSYSQLLDFVARPAPAVVSGTKPSLPAQITAKELAALARVADVFGSVLPTEVRALQPDEVSALLDEREVLKVIEKMVKTRLGDTGIRNTVLNDNDARIRERSDEEELAKLPRTKDGHFVVPDKLRGEPGSESCFSLERSEGTVQMDPEVLRALAADPEVDWFDHKDFLAMTEPTRVFSAERAMLLIKKRPELIRAVREATVRGNPTIAVQVRKA